VFFCCVPYSPKILSKIWNIHDDYERFKAVKLLGKFCACMYGCLRYTWQWDTRSHHLYAGMMGSVCWKWVMCSRPTLAGVPHYDSWCTVIIRSKATQAVTLLTSTREGLVLNSHQDSDCAEIFRRFLQSLHSNIRIVPNITIWPLPCTSLPVHYSISFSYSTI
jgi:hypothetical protein